MHSHFETGGAVWRHHDSRLPIDPDLAPGDIAEPSPTHRPTVHVHRSRELRVLAAIGSGGFAGALGRYELGLTWPTPPGRFPWATFAINSSGAFLLGLILTLVLERLGSARVVRPFFCVGVLGAWTTMSTFAVETDLLAKHAHVGLAVAYVAATVGCGLVLGWLGAVLARRFDVQGMRWSSP